MSKEKAFAEVVLVQRMYRENLEKGYKDVGLGGDSEEVVSVKKFTDGVQPAQVSVTTGLTTNLGDFSSAKVSVTVTVPCYMEEIEDAYEYAKSFSASKMLKEREEMLEALGVA